jgi:CRP/FNR family transcriptional regulator, cyclic AMP receptor protein
MPQAALQRERVCHGAWRRQDSPHVSKKQTVFSQGDCADEVFFIQKGSVKLTAVSRSGKEAIVAILTGGDFFGESCLVGQPPRTESATALTDSTIVRLAKAAILCAIQNEPAFSQMFISYLLFRNLRFQEDLLDQRFNHSEKRLARVLLLLGNSGETVPKISQQTLAEMVGTTRSRVSFFMNRFRKLGLIDYKKGLKVHSSRLIAVLRD